MEEPPSIETVLPQQFSNVSFQEISELRDKFGLKVYNEILSGKKHYNSKREFRRENKNRPRETSSKIPPFKYKTPVKKDVPIDPRFYDSYGTFEPTIFQRNYKFLKNIKKKEKKILKKRLLDPETNEEERQQINSLLQRMENQMKSQSLKKQEERLKNDERSYEINELKQGRKPQYCKKSDEKLLNLVRHYETLKEKGGLQKHIKRRRKKITQKDKKKLNFVN